MSNVLIGIIGVILFIGLALAGALFLGPRFQEANNSSKAAAVMQANQQVANAHDLYRLTQGDGLLVQDMDKLVTTGFLKSLPRIPNAEMGLLDATGCSGCGTQTMAGVGFYYGDTPEGRRICEAVSRQNGDVPPNQTFAPVSLAMVRTNFPKGQGCSLVGGGYYIFKLF